MNKSKKNLIGVAWPYVNGDLHPGHIAGCYLPADIFARYKRLKGENVLMISGCDCFGTPITIQADKEGVTPKDIIEKYVPRTTNLLLDTYKISFDSFTKTDTDLHREITQKFFINLANNGYIIKKSSQQYYSETENKFLPDRYVQGECSFCKAKDQRGDQCENCGRSLQVGELINPYASLTKSPVSLKETEHYFVDLSKFQNDLTKYINSKESIWRTWVWKEAKAWINELQPRAITRDIDWGVEIPQEGIPEELKIKGAENKRFYVWFDAVIGYFSEGIKIANEKGISTEDFLDKWWNENDENLKHYLFVGKDNLFFHTLWWQSLLIGQKNLWTKNIGDFDFKLAENVSVNQFLNLEGKKFSKSRGIYINSTEIIEKYGLDAVRFYLASIMPENSDANWKWDDFFATYNNELAGNIGNFIHRTLIFAKNKLELKELNLKPENCIIDENSFDFGNDKQMKFPISIANVLQDTKDTKSTFTFVSEYLENAEFKQALSQILFLGKVGNVYFDRKAPWKSLQENRDDCEKTIYNCLLIVNAIRILINPFLPDSSDKLSEILGFEKLNSGKSQNSNKFEFNLEEIAKIHLSDDIQPLYSKIEIEYNKKL